MKAERIIGFELRLGLMSWQFCNMESLGDFTWHFVLPVMLKQLVSMLKQFVLVFSWLADVLDILRAR